MREIQLVGRKYQYFSVGGKQKKKLVGQETAVVKVDDEDVAGLKMWEWKFAPRKSGGGYAYRDVYDASGRRIRKLMHREIMKAPPHLLVDHIDGDGLNNQKSNLRLVTPTQNQQNQTTARRDNKSGVKGVSWDKFRNRWRVSITVNGMNKTLLYTEDLELAKEKYDAAAKLYFGEYARTNEEAN